MQFSRSGWREDRKDVKGRRRGTCVVKEEILALPFSAHVFSPLAQWRAFNLMKIYSRGLCTVKGQAIFVSNAAATKSKNCTNV